MKSSSSQYRKRITPLKEVPIDMKKLEQFYQSKLNIGTQFLREFADDEPSIKGMMTNSTCFSGS